MNEVTNGCHKTSILSHRQNIVTIVASAARSTGGTRAELKATSAMSFITGRQAVHPPQSEGGAGVQEAFEVVRHFFDIAGTTIYKSCIRNKLMTGTD